MHCSIVIVAVKEGGHVTWGRGGTRRRARGASSCGGIIACGIVAGGGWRRLHGWLWLLDRDGTGWRRLLLQHLRLILLESLTLASGLVFAELVFHDGTIVARP